MRRKVGGVLMAAGLVAASAVVATATPSQAASCSPPAWHNYDSGYGYVVNWNWIHVAPYGACAGVAQPGQFKKVWYHCYVVNSYGNTWTHLRVDGTSIEGWMSDDDLSNHGSTKHC